MPYAMPLYGPHTTIALRYPLEAESESIKAKQWIISEYYVLFEHNASLLHISNFLFLFMLLVERTYKKLLSSERSPYRIETLFSSTLSGGLCAGKLFIVKGLSIFYSTNMIKIHRILLNSEWDKYATLKHRDMTRAINATIPCITHTARQRCWQYGNRVDGWKKWSKNDANKLNVIRA